MKWWKILGILFLLVIIFLAIYFYRKSSPEGFQSQASCFSAMAPLPAYWLNTYKITNSNNNAYTIFDPEAAYIQAKMLKLTLSSPYKNMKPGELAAMNNLTTGTEYFWYHRYVHMQGGLPYNAFNEFKMVDDMETFGPGGVVTSHGPPPIPAVMAIYQYDGIFYASCAVSCGNYSGQWKCPGPGSCSNICPYANIWDTTHNTPFDDFAGDPAVRLRYARVISYYYDKLFKELGLIDRFKITEDRSSYLSLEGVTNGLMFFATFLPESSINANDGLFSSLFPINNDPQVKYAIQRAVTNFDSDVIHKKMDAHPIGHILSKIQTKVNPYGSQIYEKPPCWVSDLAPQAHGAIIKDDNGNPFIANDLSLTDVTNSLNILSNPGDWTLVDLAPSGTPISGKFISDLYRNDFLAKKGLNMANQMGNILTKTINIRGTMNTTNMDEIRTSVYYSMFFNFSNSSFDTKQLRYPATGVAKLYMSNNFSFKDELLTTPQGQVILDQSAIANNEKCSIPLTNGMLLLLPYKMRTYIANWATNRRIAILRYLNADVAKSAAINEDIKNCPYNPTPTINLFSTNNANALTYIQTTEDVRLSLTGDNKITSNSTLSFKTTSLIYLTMPDIYKMVGVPLIIFTRGINSIVHSFKGEFVSFSPLPPTPQGISQGLLTINTIGYENFVTDPAPKIFVDNPVYFPYTIQFPVPYSTNSSDTTSEQRSILMDALAQCYYDNSASNDPTTSDIRITTIVDIYQVGNTIFDARYRVAERDVAATGATLAQISTLKANHELYRTQTLSESELLTLEMNYNTQLQTLSNQLTAEVQGYASQACGKTAQYVTITCPVGISLSQVEVIDNTGQNIALNANVTSGPYQKAFAYIFPYEDCSGDIIGPPQTDSGQTYTYQSMNEKYSKILNDNIRQAHLNCIVDGVLEPRFEPDIFKSPKKEDGSLFYGSKDCIEIDLGSEYSIAYVRLTHPKNTGTLPIYTITLKAGSYAAIEGGTLTTTQLTGDTFRSSAVFLPDTDTICPRPTGTLLRQYRVARFYADIQPTNRPGYIGIGTHYIKFTGYSEGVDAALSFNHMYNGGFQFDLNSAAGNANYQPEISYDIGRAGDHPTIDCSKPTQIMYDYMMNIGTTDFQNNNGTYYEDGYNYYVSTITGYANVPLNSDGYTPVTALLNLPNAKACKFSWNELKVNSVTNKTEGIFERRGTFVYTRNIYDWKLSNDYYDASHSFITSDTSPLTPILVAIPKPGIAEVTLDNLSGSCPSKTCSDLDVIDSLVQAYNLTHSDRILRVSKAVTPASHECEFECYTTAGGTIPKRIRMDMNIAMDPSTYTCKYTYKNSQIVTESVDGTYIQSNTPLLTQIYSYADQLMGYYKTSMNNIYTNLSTMVQPHISETGTGLKSSVVKYRTDTWKAFGQIKGLNTTCATSCTDPIIMHKFLKKARNFKTRISAIKGVGTSSSNTCDFMVDETALSGSTSAPVTKIYRATIDPTCAISVNLEDITAANTGAIQLLKVDKSQANFINNVPAVIRSNHVTFGDTLTISLGSVAVPAWMIKNTPVSIKSSSSYLEGSISAISGSNITFNHMINASGPFNTSKSVVGTFSASTMNIGSVETWMAPKAHILILSDPAGTSIYDGLISSTTTTSIILSSPPTNPVSVSVPATFTASTMMISANAAINWQPAWLQGGTSIQVFNATNNIVYNGAINEVSGKNIALGSANTAPSAQGTYTILLTNFNIFLYDTYTISDTSPNALSTAGTWVTPMTIGKGLYNSNQTLQVEANSTSYIVGEPIICSSDTNANPSFTATIGAYTGTTLTLTNINGAGVQGQTYIIQQTAKPVAFPLLPNPTSPIDLIDCSSKYAKAATGQQTLTQSGPNTCSGTGGPYVFNIAADPNVDTLQLASNPTPAVTSDATCTDYSVALANAGYGSLVIPGSSIIVPGTTATYEYRITTLDTLPFGDTYKRVTFYGDNGCKISDIRGADIAISPNATFKRVSFTNNISTYADIFVKWWNTKYYYASATQNKKVIGSITGYAYDSSQDAIIFRCTSAEFGPYGPADIRVYNETGQAASYPTYAYYSVVFRRRYLSTSVVPTIAPIGMITSPDVISNDFLVYSATGSALAPSISITSVNVPIQDTTYYTGMPNRDTLSYTARAPSAALTNQFRFLRFSVSQVGAPTGTGGAIGLSSASYAEITRIYFYKKDAVINPTTDGNLGNPFPMSNTDTKNNGQGIALLNATFRMSDISSNYFNYMNTDCSGGFVQIPNPYKTSYNICVVNDRDPANNVSSRYEYPRNTATTGCSIGFVRYEDSYQNTFNPDTNKCITTGTYGGVNDLLINPNKSTPRLRLNKGQQLIINLGGTLQIDAYTFITGSANNLPYTFLLEGSTNGITWKTLNSKASLAYPTGTADTFYVPGYFPTDNGATIPLKMPPNLYTSQSGANTAFEGFKNSAPPQQRLLEPVASTATYFKSDETPLEPRYALPLAKQPAAALPTNTLYQPINTQARRIKTMQFRVLETRDPASKYVNMSMFQFHTAVGPIKSSMIRLSNPMGSRRQAANAPEALLEQTTAKRWVDYNKMPLIFVFDEHPQTQITGFQFALPDAPNALDALPSRWRFEGSYDGRSWETYHEQAETALILGNTSPIYKFKKAI